MHINTILFDMIDDFEFMFLPWVVLAVLVYLIQIFQSVKSGGIQANKGNLRAYYIVNIITYTCAFLSISAIMVLPLAAGIVELIELIGLPESSERETIIVIGFELIALMIFLYVAFKRPKEKSR